MESIKTKKEILIESIGSREQEIMHYQINIDNYSLALDEIGKLSVEERAELSDFADNLRGRLASEKLEQKKSKIMLAVLQKQVTSYE
jgi:hypothetical protein